MTARFRRPQGQRRYKRMFVIVAEGTVTEQEYFTLLNEELIVHVKCLRNSGNLTPKQALKRVQDYVHKESLRKTDEVWVVVDRDSWPEEHLVELHYWAQTSPNFGFAVSNPKFEYWLVLHFEDANGVKTSDHCDERLVRHVRDYDKHIDPRRFVPERIRAAVARAKRRDTPPCADWPRSSGSTVYRLVEKILEAGSS